MTVLNTVFDNLPIGNFRTRMTALCESLRENHPAYDWIGLYWVDGDELVLGPWVGPHATEHTRIPISEGICGAAVREAQTIIIDDVQKDPRYLACFLDTRSEIVVPIYSRGEIIGEIDIDGIEIGAFGEDDKLFLEKIAQRIGAEWPGRW